MTKKKLDRKSDNSIRNGWKIFLLKKIQNLEHLILTISGALIGLTLTSLFVVVVLASLYVAILGDEAQTPTLLGMIISGVGTALGGFLGYLFAKKSGTNRKKTDCNNI